jgi:hypothetical protein
MSYTSDDKVALVTAWFNEIEEIINEIQSLSDKKYYKQIAIPALYTILERLAWFRYRRESFNSSEKFKKLLLTYSTDPSELKKIDLAFLHQWDVSEHQETAIYIKTIKKIHSQIKKLLTEVYGEISTSMLDRFIDINTLHQALLNTGICSTCIEVEGLKLFSVCEVIYRFGRCKATHEGEFIAVGFISIPLLISITRGITINLKKACIEQKKLVDEL